MNNLTERKATTLGLYHTFFWISITVHINICANAWQQPLYKLCGDTRIIPRTGTTSGTIEYTSHSNTSDSCSITIKAPVGTAHKHVVIEGVAEVSTGTPCPDHNGMLSISSTPFCINTKQFHIFKLQASRQITITTAGILPSLNITFYTTGKCTEISAKMGTRTHLGKVIK